MPNHNVRLLVGLTILLTGCEVGPDYRQPQLDLPAIDDYSKAATEDVDKFVCSEWWTVFQDSVLDTLEKQAIEHNADLKQAMANIEIAMEEAGISMSNLLPSVKTDMSGGKTHPSRRMSATATDSVDYLGTIGISYEVDFFGKYRRANEAAMAQLLSSKAAREVVMLAVTSNVAKTYFSIRALDAKLAVATRTLKTREESYSVYKDRFATGYCTELDCLRLEAEMASIKTTVLDLEIALAKAETSLKALIGCSPREIISQKVTRGASIERLKIPCNVSNNIPSDLITRRPDVLQAECQLIAANAAIGETMALHFPSFSLTAAYGFESKLLSNLFASNANMWKFLSGISLPIFNGGKISAMTRKAEINYQKALLSYGGAVKTAFREVLDSLISRRKNSEIVVSRTRQVNALKKSYNLALSQKESGLIGLLDLLDVERGLLSAEMELVAALQNHLNSVVDLCKALGGGWKQNSLL
ncbi:MAG: efflux transporter outer membrane subunit [Holosporaceae bacterium]|jgi:multidrug efflux system outer membrane protein|nr:efflux transporter outer membrane subunit [Holosporaceae bacterium]